MQENLPPSFLLGEQQDGLMAQFRFLIDWHEGGCQLKRLSIFLAQAKAGFNQNFKSWEESSANVSAEKQEEEKGVEIMSLFGSSLMRYFSHIWVHSEITSICERFWARKKSQLIISMNDNLFSK